MDPEIASQLEAAGLSTAPEALPLALRDASLAQALAQKPCSALFTGDRQPPPMREEPPDAYLPFFVTLERAAALACAASGHAEPDDEFERLYRYLKKRPDGVDRNPMFSVLQQAARLYMSLHDTSRPQGKSVGGEQYASGLWGQHRRNTGLGGRS